MSRLIINIRDGVSEAKAIRHVAQVIEEGRVSNEGKQYCYVTTFMDGVGVSASITKNGTDTFTVWREK